MTCTSLVGKGLGLRQRDDVVSVMANNSGTFDVHAQMRQLADHHYDDQKLGKPLYLLSQVG